MHRDYHSQDLLLPRNPRRSIPGNNFVTCQFPATSGHGSLNVTPEGSMNMVLRKGKVEIESSSLLNYGFCNYKCQIDDKHGLE